MALALAFPPFQHVAALSNAVLPSFEGFYFVGGTLREQVLVAPLVWIEETLLVANGLLLWLMLRPQREPEITSGEALALMRDLAAGRH